MSAAMRLLPDGRLHLQHGPIDCILRAWGEPAAVRASYAAAAEEFPAVLPTLCAELPVLRAPVGPGVSGPVAQRMRAACLPFAAEKFITPMAAVAGSVADHLLAVMCAAAPLTRAFVNDGGDIAFHLAPGESLACGLVADLDAPALDGTFALTHALPARGIATSGAKGRSFSLGIAESVTVLARDAATADAAATLVANAVDLPGHPAIVRVPAQTLDPDSDLGARLVTRQVPTLAQHEVARALEAGAALAERFRAQHLIHAAVLVLQGRARSVGLAPARLAAASLAAARLAA